MRLSRRHFIRTAAAFAAGFTGLHRFTAVAGVRRNGYGPIVPDPQGIFDLPEGFSYQVIARAGDMMNDGFHVPSAPDGMAAFPGPRNRTILVQNHEINLGTPGEDGPFGAANHLLEKLGRDALYDAGAGDSPCLGGTTTIVYDTRYQHVTSQHLSLAGTLRNCAGGPTPWGSWITCEESTVNAGDIAAKDHGFTFEVPASPHARVTEPVPLKAMGRFNHEAVAVDPASGIVFETEDQHDGLIYRFIPTRPEHLEMGGRLQALAVRERPSLDTRNWETPDIKPGEWMDVEWIDLEDVESPEDDLRLRGFASGAARFARGEGMWYGNGAIYFACTNGGRTKSGQIWRYQPGPNEGRRSEHESPGRLQLFVEPNDTALVENCDNVTVSPWGDLILCEDGSEHQNLVGVTPSGELYQFGRNAISESELTGATFSPDGSTLFMNIQHDGLTLAITGPWKSSLSGR